MNVRQFIRFTFQGGFGLKLFGKVLLTKGTIKAEGIEARLLGVEDGAVIGRFFNVYILGRKTIYMGRRAGKFYARGWSA